MQTSEYNANEKRVIWNIKKFPGATEQMLRIKVCIHTKRDLRFHAISHSPFLLLPTLLQITLAGGSGSNSSTSCSSSMPSGNAGGGGGGAMSGAGVGSARKEIGPVSMSFEIPMYNVSNLQVRYLRISEQQKSYNPYRWVRYVTQASSFVCRVGTGTER